MNGLTVAADSDALQPGAIAAALASLPMTLRATSGPHAALRAIGGGAGWCERAAAALSEGARGVLVARPTAVDVAQLSALAEHDAPIVLDTRWRHNPAVARVPELLAALDGGVSLFEAHAYVADEGSLDDAMRDLALLAQAAGGQMRHVSTVQRSVGRLVVHGQVGGDALHAVVDVTSVGSGTAWLRALGASGGVQLMVPDAGTARAARVTVTDPGGHTLLPLLHESAHRNAWRRLAADVQQGSPASDIDDLRIVTAAFAGEV
ncbi:MAG TPA: hypothetical protein VN133_14985 [Humibacter sp.]|nr:hypothetical protein [Humibacter sp.]